MKTVQYTTKDIDEIVKELSQGKVIAFPTDTVYGLGVSYYNEEALNRLKRAKIRPEEKAIPTMVASMEQLEEIAVLNEDAIKLAKTFMPGALTLIVKRREGLNSFHTNGLDTIGVRMPDDPFILKLIQTLDCPMLVTSANISGGENCFTSTQVLEQLDGKIDGIVLGKAQGAQASSIVDTLNSCKLIRNGNIRQEQVDEAISK